MGMLNLIIRGVFLLAYFALRVGVFPYYMFVAPASVLPDIAKLLALDKPLFPAYALWGIGIFGFALTLLQFYWGYLLIKQVQKMLAGPKDKSRKKK